MTSQLPEGAAAYSARLSQASDEELAQVLADQAAHDPELLIALADAIDEAADPSISLDVLVGQALDNDADFVEVPLDEAAVLKSLLGRAPHADEQPVVLRLNVRSSDAGSDVEVDLVMPQAARAGVRVTCEYLADIDDVVLEAAEGNRLVGRSTTAHAIAAEDSVRLRLVVRDEEVA